MFKEEFEAVSNAAKAKVDLLNKNLIGYFTLSVNAGIFIGIGVLLIFTISGALNGSVFTKVLMGMSFGIALSLVVMAGAELFTGNNFVLTAGLLKKKVTLKDAIKLWIICWIGNLVGGILLSVVFHLAGLNVDATANAIVNGAAAKMNASFTALLFRGILCNMLVCLAVWCGIKCKSESGKLIMIFWCLFAFITSGYEHSIANMTLLTTALLNPLGNSAITLSGYVYNLGVVTLGNMIGGIFLVAIPYYLAQKN